MEQTHLPRNPRLPAEWERHAAVWLGWPHNASDWGPKFPAIPWVFGEMVRLLAPSETVRVLVNDAAHEASARNVLDKAWPGWEQRLGADGSPAVELLHQPTNRGWTRDFMPFFVETATGGAVVRCAFDGWSRYDDHELDAMAGEAMAALTARRNGLALFTAQHQGRVTVLEGGAVDGNGQGQLLVTEECLQDPERQVRNPGWSKGDYEAFFRDWLGVSQTIWLGRGIQGDDTHGHVDDFCRFTAPRTVLLCEEQNPEDPNHQAMEENRERLEGLRFPDGGRLEIVRLPMPAPVYFGEERLPASYANFYIGNSVVLVPTFNDPQDRAALGLIAEHFPGRAVVGLHAVDLVLGLGTVHCLTHEQPVLG